MHVQSFQTLFAYTKLRWRISYLSASGRANQELQNAFLEESLAPKEAEIYKFKADTLSVLRDIKYLNS